MRSEMKVRNRDAALLFPELCTGPENPWITASAKRTGESSRSRLTVLELCASRALPREPAAPPVCQHPR
jgi:hypothetical protein